MPPQKHNKMQPRPSPLDEPPTASSSGSDEENQHHPSSPPLLHQNEQQVSSQEEEEASSSEEEEEEASEDLPPPISKNPPTNPPNQASSSSSETQSGSDTESEPDPTPVPAKVKPLASKPMDQPTKPKSQPSPALSKSASKRPAVNNNNAARATDPKRAKKKGTDSSAAAAASDEEMEEEGKKSGEKKVLRVWSEEDEVALLKGVSDFTAKTGQDPLKSTNSNAFYNFVKKLMHGDPSSIQLKEKVRRLKKKYEILAARASKGESPKFVKLHDERIFELSKKVWGAADLAVGPPDRSSLDNPKSNANAANTPKKKQTVNRTIPSAKKSKPELLLAAASPELKSRDKLHIVQVPHVKFSDKMQIDQNVKSSDKMLIDQKPDGGDASSFLRELARFKEGVSVSNLDEDDVKRGLELIGESKRAELRARWKKLQHAEMELLANRLELIGEQTKLILEALRSSNY